MSTRRDLRAQGEEMRARLFGPAKDAEMLYGYRDLAAETTYGSIWCRPGLALADRMVCTLAALCAVQQLPQLRRYVGAALNLELPREAAFEIFLQIGIYAGFAAAEAAIEAAAAVYKERGVALPQGAARNDPLELLTQRGHEVMDKLHGKRGVQGYAAPDNPFTSRLYPMTIPYGYGEIWQRPGLELRQRALCSLAGFTALHLNDQLKKFGQSALNIGLTMDEVCEAIIQTAPYSGYAPALNALRWLSEVR
jgi:alkylhydroperoxidase/carboxymuconolactone decarboxylase family protein YurZ